MIVSDKEFAEVAGITVRTLRNWRKDDGFPTVEEAPKVRINLIEGLKWQLTFKKDSPLKDFMPSVDEDGLSVEDQLRVKRMEKLDLEMAISRGEYIPIDEVDDTTAQMVSLLVNQFRQLLKILPKQLAKKTETQIKKVLDIAFKSRIEELEKLFNEEIDANRQKDTSGN